MESTGVIELTAADIEELESIELKALPEFSEDAAPLTNEELEDPTSVDEALVVAEPTIVEDTGVIARLVLETVPPEQPARRRRAAEAPAAQPAAEQRSVRARGNRARRRRAARRAAQRRRRDQHLPVAAHAAAALDRVPPWASSAARSRGCASSCASSKPRPRRRSCTAIRTTSRVESGFDPLELDRYSTIQQLSRALAESANDVASINELLHGLTNEADTLLTQQARVTVRAAERPHADAHGAVPAARPAARSASCGRRAPTPAKQAELVVEGESSEIDRQVLESHAAAVRAPAAQRRGARHRETRRRAGSAASPRRARCSSRSSREGAEVIIEVGDDGGGLDSRRSAARPTRKACSPRTRRSPTSRPIELILQPGFSTAERVTQAAGRGVGMDVVDNEVKKLGGSMRIEIEAGRGHAIPDPVAVHARDHARVDRERRRRDVRAAAADGRGHHAAVARQDSEAPDRGRAQARLRRHRLPDPAPRQPRRRGAVCAARGRERRVARADPRRRELDGAVDGFARRQPRDRREDARAAHRERRRASRAPRSWATAA